MTGLQSIGESKVARIRWAREATGSPLFDGKTAGRVSRPVPSQIELPDNLEGFRLMRKAQDIGCVTGMVGNHEVPVMGIDRPLGGVNLKLV